MTKTDVWHTFAARAMHLLARTPSGLFVVIMQNLHLSTKADSCLTFSPADGSSSCFAVYGSAGLSPVSVLEKEDIVCFRSIDQVSEFHVLAMSMEVLRQK